MRTGVIRILASVLVLAALASAEAAGGEEVSRRLIVKLRPAAGAPLDALSALGSASTKTPDADVLGFLARYQARAIRPALSGRTAAARRAGLDGAGFAETVRRRYSARARRARDPRTPDLSRIYILELEAGVEPAQVKAALEADGAVEYAELDKVVKTQLLPNDPYLGSSGSWGQSYADLWGLHKIGAPAAWDATTGEGVLVAVVDTGLDVSHPDLAGNVWQNAGEVPGNLVDDDGNGFVDDVNGWDFIGTTYQTPTSDATPEDQNGHGTHVAGTIAATGDDGVGVIGVAWRAKVMAAKGLDRSGTGWSSLLADAIVYAADNGADVINNSWGGPGASPFVRDAVAYAHGLGAVVVAAAGNDDEDAAGYYPPTFPEVIVVASTDPDDYKSSFSNWGSRIDVAAPGRDILSLRAAGTNLGRPVGTRYMTADGTSMAAPHVSGLAALMLAAHPDYTNEQVRQVLRASAADKGTAGFDRDYGFGRVNASAAVAFAAPLEAKILAPRDSTHVAGPADVLGIAQGAGFTSFILDRGAGTRPTTWTTIADSTLPVAQGQLGVFDSSTLSDGVYTLRLRVFDGSGRVFSDYVELVVDFVSIASPAPPLVPTVSETRMAGAPLAIVGTATGPDFRSFQVEWARGINPAAGWSASGVSLAGGGGAPVTAGDLATWDTTDVTQADFHTLRVRVDNGAFTSEARTIVYIEPDLLNASWPKWLPDGPDEKMGAVAGVDASGDSWLSVGAYAWLGNTERKFRAFRADGGAQFESPMDFATSFLQHAAGDLDGLPGDEFVVNDAQSLRIYRMDGSYATLNTDVWRNFQRSTTVLCDLDGDGRLEVLAAGHNRGDTEVGIYAWRASGEILPGFPILLQNLNRNVAYSVPLITIADFDLDGRPDILTFESASTSTYTLRLFSAQGTPLARTFPTFPDYPRELVLGDFERDGSPEIVLTSIESSVWTVHVIQADGQERPGWPLQNRKAYALADFDRDGQHEIVVKGEGLSIRRADGSLYSAAWPRPEDVNRPFGRPFAADVTGDGVPEILVTRMVDVNSPSPLVTAAPTGTAAAERPMDSRGADEQGNTASLPPSGQVKTWRYSSYLQLVAFDRDNNELRHWNLLGMNGAAASLWSDAIAAGDYDADGMADLAVTYRVNGSDPVAGVLTVLRTGAPYVPSDWPMLNHDRRNTNALVVPDTASPAVSISAPAPGATVAGVYTARAQVSDDGWIAGVRFLLDGQPLGAEDTWPPFQVDWDTTATAPGPHQLSAIARDGAGHTAMAAPVDVVVDQSSSPAIVITSPSDAQVVAGTVDVLVDATDDHRVASVELLVDGVPRDVATVAPFRLRWRSWQDTNGPHVLVARAYDDHGNVTASAPVGLTLQNQAAWSSTNRAPTCASVSSVCDTAGLVDGRGPVGPEPNQPNTIGGSCPDTSGGTYHDNTADAIDRVRIYTADGSRFAPGRTVTIETTVWASVFYKSRTLQIFHAANAASPSWQLVAQLKPPGSGQHILSTPFQLPAGTTQAFRAQYSGATNAPACLTSYGYTDHDDLVFAVGTNRAPAAVAGGPYSGESRRPLAFDGSASSDPDGDALTYSWDFGDGSPLGGGPTPTHAYATDGTFTVTLTVSDGVASSTPATTTATISVPPNRDPVAHPGGPYAGVRQQAIVFDGTASSDPDGDALTYAWDFGDGTPLVAGPTPSHAYATLGTFTVTLTVMDDEGGSNGATTTATITNRNPIVSAGADQTVELGTSATVVASASDPDGDPLTFEWRGEAGALLGTAVSLTLSLPVGAHDLTVTVQDGLGGSAPDTVRVTVQDTTAPVVTVTSPEGVQLLAGVATLVQWTASDLGGLAGFDVLSSADGGASFTPVPGCTGLSGSARSCTWASPGPASPQARIRVVARDAASNSAQDDSAFTIVAPVLTVTSPNTAVSWGLGSLRTITWTDNLPPGGTVTIELSPDGGSSWSVLAASAPDTGSFGWTVNGSATSAARIRITSNTVAAATDASDTSFSIVPAAITVTSPNTNVRWRPGTTQTIRWNHNLGTQASVSIEVSRDGGSTWSVIAASVANGAGTTGSYNWVVTSPNTTKARIRVRWTANTAVNDRSDVNFSIR